MLREAAQIPTLPVLLPLTVVALTVMLWTLRCRHATTGPRLAVGVASCVYGAGVFKAVLLPFPLVSGSDGVRMGWHAYIHLTPLLTADPIGIVLNVALFLPLGVLVPLVARVTSVRRVLRIAFLLSLSIEVVQFVADVTISSGRVADIDDVLSNCCGAIVGYALLCLAVRVPPAARFAAAATWPAPRSAEPKA